ncbi:sulfite oxidase heme-binding subunit YedZ [Aurantiacibacter poecillastricola]|uniref:sulfite oxidase heme-binding subunit YedZ n=1 Tax=Aurantiacibacter poecillastricola TaxID=3064385 RepID=UPI00273DB896|nr:ferric reductase-like transmembrane domain-containing protein [Aurantiacibacter sp. 219JJ12-13]MDP5261065.1 ferric reductase-like transmembrane domain-containing protein [Aurantiacibacter sp. 219JJ12-13]
MRLSQVLKSQKLLWLVLALPGAWIAWRWAMTPESYGFGHAIGDSGDWATYLLMATLLVTPIRLVTGRARWTGWLLKRRRDLGVASFAYAAAHTGVYLANKASPPLILEEALRPDMLTGWLALALFAPLAITSNDASMRMLRRSWKRLHRLVYPAAVLVFVHWALAAFDPATAYILGGILAAAEIVRLWLERRPKRAQSVT